MQQKTITARQLEAICKTISLSTIILYLENYNFSKYRLSNHSRMKTFYRLNQSFLDTFYTYLFYRGQFEAAENTKKHFQNEYRVKAIELS